MNKTTTTLASSLALLTIPFVTQAADIFQTQSAPGGVGWNDPSIWDGSAPTAGNDYFTADIGGSYVPSNMGPSVSTSLRAVDDGLGLTFDGDSLTVVGETQFLIKDSDTFTSNLILDGGVLRNDTGNGALAGTLHVASESYLGGTASSGQDRTLTVNSTLTGSSLLHITAGFSGDTTVVFGGDISAYTGTLDIGGTESMVTADFSGLTANSATMKMGDYTTVDVLNLDDSLSIGSFAFGGSSLGAGTYTTTELNSLYGNGSQFQGAGELTVIPEPSTLIMALAFSFSGLALTVLRRKHRA